MTTTPSAHIGAMNSHLAGLLRWLSTYHPHLDPTKFTNTKSTTPSQPPPHSGPT